ncbi:MAG TPA: sulfatase-like hydrolase/transferase, partial [Candidatus Deferrimicrobium sp.]|nr:sulfatase-like hydrolase/transferase [Candidatus Deferrimicrobium sp.]
FRGDRDFSRSDYFSKWGVPDHVVFQRTAALIDSLPRPFQLTILTISNHEPFDLPDSSVRRYPDDSDTSRLFNSQIYADHALGLFISEVRSYPVFDSTVFVFTADHARFGGGRYRGDPVDFHVPLLLYAPGIAAMQPGRIETFGSQIDIVPTLMGLLGGDYRHASWGRNLLTVPADDPGFAPISVFERIGSVDRQYHYTEILGRTASLFETGIAAGNGSDIEDKYPAAFQSRQRRLRIFMQVAEQLSTPAQR